MLTDKAKPQRWEVPGEPGAWFELRQVTGDELDEARIRFQQRTMAMEVSPGMARAMSEIPRGTREAQDLTVEQCDRATLVRYGLAAWGGPGYEGEPCIDERKAMLDARTRDAAAAEIFRLSYVTLGEAQRSEPSSNGAETQISASELSIGHSSTPVSISRLGADLA